MNLMLFVIGACITACRGTRRHIVALEEDKETFEVILLPMRKKTPVVVPTKPQVDVAPSQDLNAITVMCEPRIFHPSLRLFFFRFWLIFITNYSPKVVKNIFTLC